MPVCLLLVAATCLPLCKQPLCLFQNLLHCWGMNREGTNTGFVQRSPWSCFVTGVVPSSSTCDSLGLRQSSDHVLVQPWAQVCLPQSWLLCLKAGSIFPLSQPIYWCYYFVLLIHLSWIFFLQEGRAQIGLPVPKYLSAVSSGAQQSGAVAPMTGTVEKVIMGGTWIL